MLAVPQWCIYIMHGTIHKLQHLCISQESVALEVKKKKASCHCPKSSEFNHNNAFFFLVVFISQLLSAKSTKQHFIQLLEYISYVSADSPFYSHPGLTSLYNVFLKLKFLLMAYLTFSSRCLNVRIPVNHFSTARRHFLPVTKEEKPLSPDS